MKHKFQRTTKKETAIFGNQYAKFPKRWIVKYCVEADTREQAKKELDIEILVSGFENKFTVSAK